MPNGQAPQQQAQPSPILEKLHDMFWNAYSRILGPANIWRYRTLRGQAAPIKALLPVSLNENLIRLLKKIETTWKIMDTYLWDPPKKIFAVYEKLAHYDDPAVVMLEAEKFRTGGEFTSNITTGYSELNPVEVKWRDSNTEELYIFGFSKMAEILQKWKNLEETLDQRAIAAGMDAGNRRFATNLRSGVSALLTRIQQSEHAIHDDLLLKIGFHADLATLRNEFLSLTEAYNQFLRFKHTYKVIKPFVIIEIPELEYTVKREENGKVIEEKVIPKMPMYFNPNDNPYKRDLEAVNREIEAMGVNTSRLNDQLTAYDRRLRQINDEIKQLKSKAIKGDFKKALISNLYKELWELNSNKISQTQDFLTEKRKKMAEILRLLRFINLKFTRMDKEPFTANDGTILRTLDELLNALRAGGMDERIFRSHIRRDENDFANWIKFSFKDDELARAIFNSRTREDIVRILEPISASPKQYDTKINELFTQITTKFTEFKINIDKDTSRSFDNWKRRLKQQPYDVDDKKNILRELYNKLRGIISNEINEIKENIRNFLKDISQKINELADSAELHEFRDKRDALFELIKTKLKESGIEESKADNFIEYNLKNLVAAINNREINRKNRLRDSTSSKRDSLYELKSKKEQLELYVSKLTPDDSNFDKRDDNEVDYGLDENGYQLEIDHDGTVLLDKWWNEIGQNEWQLKTIAKKIGGHERLEKELGVGVQMVGEGENREPQIIGTPQRTIRRVDPKFATNDAYIDLLEMAIYIYNEVDSIRDDLRDGRYHKHSKTVTDYIIHAESSLKLEPNKFTKISEILKKPIELSFNQFDTTSDYGYIRARPEYFDRNIPAEEQDVKRSYTIKEINRSTGQFTLGSEKERKPSNLSPAFDRRALNRGESTLLIHWGRMYYYDETEGINKWSENPYPHISTRGVAKYIMYWIATRTQTLQEAIDAAESEEGYDIGIRRPLVGGTFIKNPFREIISQ